MNEREMNEIEERLAAMKPAEPGPALEHRIGSSLGELHQPPAIVWSLQHRVLAGLAVAALIALAGFVVVQVFDHSGSGPVVGNTPPASEEHITQVQSQAADLQPTLMAFNQALRRNPQSIDQLMDRFETASVSTSPTDRPQTLSIAQTRRWTLTQE